MRSNIIIVAGLLLFIAIVMSTWSPERLQAEQTVVTDHGVVAEVYETALKDLVVKLQDRSEIFYLDQKNRPHISFDELKSKLLNQPVRIEYPEKWKPLKDQQPQHYVSKLEIRDEIVFAEDE